MPFEPTPEFISHDDPNTIDARGLLQDSGVNSATNSLTARAGAAARISLGMAGSLLRLRDAPSSYQARCHIRQGLAPRFGMRRVRSYMIVAALIVPSCEKE